MSVPRFLHAALLSSLIATTACGSSGPFTWYSALPAAEWNPAPGEYIIGVGDSIDVRVYDQANLSLRGRVRRDGRLALPLVGEVVVAGKAPAALSRELEQRLKQFIVSPRVTVNVEESVPVTISVLGEVGARGNLTLTPPATLVQALAQAGGLSEFADDESIYVLRKAPKFRRIRFTYNALLTNHGGASTFPLLTGDVVVVE